MHAVELLEKKISFMFDLPCLVPSSLPVLFGGAGAPLERLCVSSLLRLALTIIEACGWIPGWPMKGGRLAEWAKEVEQGPQVYE